MHVKDMIAVAAEAMAIHLQLYTALQMLPLARSPSAVALKEWLEAMQIPNGALAVEEELAFEVSLTADLRRLTWRAAGDSTNFFPRISNFLAKSGISGVAAERLGEAGEEIEPDMLGMWIELFNDNLDIGWYLPVEIPLVEAWTCAIPSVADEMLNKWVEQYNITACARLGGSLEEGNAFSELLLPLPGDDPETQLRIGLEAFAALEIRPLPSTAVEVLRAFARPGLLLSIWLAGDGVAKLGLLAPRPSLDLMLQLCGTAGVNNDDILAAFQGSLGVEGPEYVECQQLVEGFGVEFHYAPEAICKIDDVVIDDLDEVLRQLPAHDLSTRTTSRFQTKRE